VSFFYSKFERLENRRSIRFVRNSAFLSIRRNLFGIIRRMKLKDTVLEKATLRMWLVFDKGKRG